jgi:hypothetical protein
MEMEDNTMSPTTLSKKNVGLDKKIELIRAGGSVKTVNKVDTDAILKEVRGK